MAGSGGAWPREGLYRPVRTDGGCVCARANPWLLESKRENRKSKDQRQVQRGNCEDIELSGVRDPGPVRSDEWQVSLGGAKKCEKMRFEATKLLKIKEVDLERTQIRTQKTCDQTQILPET